MNKKLISLALTLALVLATAGCAGAPTTNTPSSQAAVSSEAPAGEPSLVKVTDSDGAEVTVRQNPKTVAIYDYSILDILQSVGFEKTGIQQLIVPTKEKLPEALAYYKNLPNDKVVTGGNLFYVDWDVLDLAKPDLVIFGARSFKTNAAGESLSKEDAEKYVSDTRERYAEASFVKLSTNASNSQLTKDIENNVAALAAIFPELKPELESKLAKIKSDMATIHDKAQASGKKALFAMMVDQSTLSVFNPDSRFDMLYEDFGFIPVDGGAVKWTDQHGFDVRAEYVLEKNPDVIFLLDRSATVGTGAGAENFMKDPIIAKTQAAINKQIYVLTGDAWYTMTGGFSATESMIADLNQYISTLN